MNIHFSELENNENQNFDYESEFNAPEKYWDQPIQAPVKKKKVSFDDILSNMNLVVNQKGILQFMQPMQNEEYYPEPQYEQPYQEYVAQQLSQRSQQQTNQQQTNQQQANQQQAPIDPSLKHSFLYNKYFKDYKDANTYEPQIRVPKTMEEYRQMLLEDKIKEIEQKKKISQIKSTKLLFTTNINNQSNNIIPSRNNLRSMNFH
jgi:hypothetical protein